MGDFDSKHVDFAFLGMGCSNSLLLMALHHGGHLEGKKILVAEPSRKDKNDRTFCFWMLPGDVKKYHLDAMVCMRWPKVSINHLEAQEMEGMDYCCIRSIDLYNHAREILTQHQAEWSRSAFQGGPAEQGDGAVCPLQLEETGPCTADWVFDSRPPSYAIRNKSESMLLQSFFGWEIETSVPVFNTGSFTMMDLSVPQDGHTQFMYVLPFHESKALFEVTRFGSEPICREGAENLLRQYIEKHSDQYRITDFEQGVIPMNSAGMTIPAAPNHWIYTGERGGRLKPSTGYSFVRSLKHAEKIVMLVSGATLPPDENKARFAYYDRLLLQILRDSPHLGAPIFSQLFRRNPASGIFAFLDEKTSLQADLKILSSLPLRPFIRASVLDALWSVLSLFKKAPPVLICSIFLLALQSLNLLYLSVPVFVLGLLLIGLPHGAVDHLSVLSGRMHKLPAFTAGYLAMGALVYLVFFLSPSAGLSAFLLYSFWHFGQADFGEWTLQGKAAPGLWGMYWLMGILLSHPDETREIVSQMLNGHTFRLVLPDWLWVFWLAGGGLLWLLLYRNAGMFFSIVALLLLVPVPLLHAFGAFFIFQHSLHGWRQLRRVYHLSDTGLWKKALPFTLGALVLFAGIGYFFRSFQAGQIFIFLAALSFPHVWYMHRLYRRDTETTD